MSFFDVNKEDVESFTLVTNPKRFFRSSSIESTVTPHGITGSIYLSSRRMSCVKDIHNVSNVTSSQFSDDSIESLWREMKNVSGTTNITNYVEQYMTAVRAASTSESETNQVYIERYIPSYTFTENTLRKQHIKEGLNKFYRTRYPSAHWSYTNYNCLNFFTSSQLPSDSALIYPNTDGGDATSYVSGAYALTGAFSLCCRIKPSQKNDINREYKAGTIYHMSSCYALSLVSGSSKDGNGNVDAFRLLLQLSHSADIAPSLATNGTRPSDLIFLSDDNSIKFGDWNDVVVRWGTSTINDGTGSFIIDGLDKGSFIVPSSTIAPVPFTVSSQPDALIVGNFYEGTNSGSSSQSYFFSSNAATRNGIKMMNADTSFDEPTGYEFAHPLKAEIHELKIATKYYNDGDIADNAAKGLSSIPAEVVFYVPPLFTRESPLRRSVGTYGGVMITPFQEIDGTTIDPFNVALSFDVGGHSINLENFVRDFAQSTYPLLLSLTGSVISSTSEIKTANQFLYSSGSFKKKNLSILPCDDGTHVPNFYLLQSGSVTNSKYTNDMGVTDLSMINLDNLCSTGSAVFGTSFEKVTVLGKVTASNDFISEQVGPSPEYPKNSLGTAWNNYASTISQTITAGTFLSENQREAPYTIYQRTKDPSSNEIVMFTIDDLFYGTRVRPTTLVMTDSDLSGSDGEISITLRDDGFGNIYRDDTVSKTGATWNSVGNIYYDEGLILIKSPHLALFGKHQFEISFEGEQNIHVMALDVMARAGTLNSSSNPSYNSHLSASGYPNDPDSKFVYITTLNLHDDNYNVIARAKLAQPIVKRNSDSYTFRVKIDF